MKSQHYGRKKDARALPSEQNKWREAAGRKLTQTGSIDQSEKYANHKMKAAIHRRTRKKDGGLFNNG